MIFTSSSVEVLLSRWEIGEYVSEGLVIIGCAGELAADLGRRCIARKRREHLERWSTILLVAALIASLVCLERTNVLSGNIIGSLGDKAKDANDNADRAVKASKAAGETARGA